MRKSTFNKRKNKRFISNEIKKNIIADYSRDTILRQSFAIGQMRCRAGHSISGTILRHFFNISSIIIEEMLKKRFYHIVFQPMLLRAERLSKLGFSWLVVCWLQIFFCHVAKCMYFCISKSERWQSGRLRRS